jgi:hypothetical protein
MFRSKYAIRAIFISMFLMSSASAQGASPSCPDTLPVIASASVRIADFPANGSFVARGVGELCYQVEKDGALIDASTLPLLVYEAPHAPAGLKALTVIAEGMPGMQAVVSWKGWPVVTFGPLDVRVRAYETPFAEIRNETAPILDLIVPELSFTTGEVQTMDEVLKGYIDGEMLEALLIAGLTLPADDHPLYRKWFAGREAAVELTVRVDNPWERQVR